MSLKKRLFFLLICLIISDSLTLISNSGTNFDYFTGIVIIAEFVALYIIFSIAKKSSWSTGIPVLITACLKLFLLWNIITIIRGGVLAADYWDWKFLLLKSTFFFLIPLAFFIGSNIGAARILFKYIIKFLFLFGFLFIPLSLVTNYQLYSRLMIPVSVFIVFIPYLKPKWRLLVLVVMIVSILVVIDFRTNIIKSVISLLICSLYLIRRYLIKSWLKALHIIIFATPLLFLTFAVTGSYNIFKSTSEIKNPSLQVKSKKQGYGDEESLTADTRTFLYVEVFKSLIKNGNLIIGEGGSGKYKSDYFDAVGDHRGRYGSEVGFLNILLYSGIVGLLIYFMILFLSSYYAIYRSNNFLCKMLGLLISARWSLFFIEEFTTFDLNTLFTWITIGLVSSVAFRSLTDNELKLYFRF